MTTRTLPARDGKFHRSAGFPSPAGPTPPSAIEQYRELCLSGRLFIEEAENARAGAAAHHLRFAVHPAAGRGWAEVVQICNGLTIGRADYELRYPSREDHSVSPGLFGFCMLLSGSVDFGGGDRGVKETARAGDVWFRGGEFGTAASGTITSDQPAGRRMQGISIDMPPAMVEALVEEHRAAPATLLAECLRGRRPFFVAHAAASAHAAQAAGCLLAKRNESVVGRLELESLALDLLAQVLGSLSRPGGGVPPPKTCRRRRAALDDALDILRSEYAQPHTIASLSRRVGLNECYLKSAFREYAGTTIAAYLRTLRMRRAREMIESGNHTVQQVALFVGYANPSHFAAAFRGIFGISPSALRQADASPP